MKKIIVAAIVVISIALFLWWLIPWIQNGGLPSSGPVGGTNPIHILLVKPEDGDQVRISHGYCATFRYDAGNGLGENKRDTIKFYIDGKNVTDGVFDYDDLEYPLPIGELCYKGADELASGWHTAKISYEDIKGQKFAYTWRFQVIVE